MNKTVFNFEQNLGRLIGRTGRALANRLNHNFEKAGYDVTCEQWALLKNLYEKNGQTQKELANCCCKDKTSITRLIDGLEKRNLVVRIPDKEDGRIKLIYLTNQGKELQKKLLQLVQATLNEAQTGVSRHDLKVCKDVLTRVANNLN